MIAGIIDFISKTLVPFGFFGVFAGSVIEELIAFIPSAIVSMGAGYFFLSGTTGPEFAWNLFFYVVLPVTLGIMIGSLPIYYFCFYLGEPFILKWGKWFGIKKEDLEKMHRIYSKSKFDELLVFVSRVIPFLPSVAVSAFAGITRIPVKSFLIGTFLGTPVRAIFFAIVGWQMGAFYNKYADLFDYYDNVALISIICLFVIFVIYRKLKEKTSKKVL